MLVPFGAIHPNLDDMAAEIRRQRELGVTGISLHPVMNQFYADDPKMFLVYEELGDGMMLAIRVGSVLHVSDGDPLYAAPQRIMNVVRKFPKLKMIALHLGGFYMLEEAE